jgi:adenylosuccinate synthase
MNIAVLGAQWGDEGKGKVVDLLTPNFSIVARYQGGHNAGHTVYANGGKFVLRLLPSGILHSGITCVIGNGVVVDPQALFAEIDELASAGIAIADRLVISDKAHLILPYHRELDLLSEARRGERKIGTTSRGNRIIAESKMDAEQVLADLAAAWKRMRPWVTDVSLFLARARAAGRSIMFEGAQGTLLDIDHGTYPYVTSSNATTGGVCTGLGIPPRAIDGVIGVAKAYTTRVGGGPLPTELTGEIGHRLRESGQEFGAVTGRPRRCGWFDAVAVRYAVRVNGLDALALTKLDVLDGMRELQICTSYRSNGATLTEFPGEIAQLGACEPVYESMPGWTSPTAGVRSFSDLPREAQRYIARLEELTGVPSAILSTGSAREDTIIREDSVASRWGLELITA